MSISITCTDLIKRYGNNTVIDGLSLNIKQGEFFTLLGPSGCGKTTLLRMMIGFNSIEGGTIVFGNRIINDVPPSKRNVGMVFQNYAVFPHMTAFENVAFGLKNRNIPKNEITERVDKILKVVHIEDLRDRHPDKMSGGQQQRIALARAIVINPDLLLMDEPLSNLDAKLRIEMRTVIKEIQNELGITTVYVTHDQEEALAVSDHIAVMNKGKIQHVGTPQNIYMHPANQFVASFIGRTNILEAEYDGTNVCIENEKLIIADSRWSNKPSAKQKLVISARPEEISINTEGKGIPATIIGVEFLGLTTHYFLKLDSDTRVEAIRVSDFCALPVGIQVGIILDSEKVNIFDERGEQNLMVGVENEL